MPAAGRLNAKSSPHPPPPFETDVPPLTLVPVKNLYCNILYNIVMVGAVSKRVGDVYGYNYTGCIAIRCTRV